MYCTRAHCFGSSSSYCGADYSLPTYHLPPVKYSACQISGLPVLPQERLVSNKDMTKHYTTKCSELTIELLFYDWSIQSKAECHFLQLMQPYSENSLMSFHDKGNIGYKYKVLFCSLGILSGLNQGQTVHNTVQNLVDFFSQQAAKELAEQLKIYSSHILIILNCWKTFCKNLILTNEIQKIWNSDYFQFI